MLVFEGVFPNVSYTTLLPGGLRADRYNWSEIEITPIKLPKINGFSWGYNVITPITGDISPYFFSGS